jgi:serine/threonine protein kinase
LESSQKDQNRQLDVCPSCGAARRLGTLSGWIFGTPRYKCRCQNLAEQAGEPLATLITEHHSGLKNRAAGVLVAPDTLLLNRYRLKKIIGSGASGNVYEADDTTRGKPCAIKILRPELINDQNSIKRFDMECQTLSGLVHPNLAVVYDSGLIDKALPYIVMELLSGETLDILLKAHGTLPVEKAMLIFLQVCSAVDYAHSQGVIHRDLKPSNIIVNEKGRKITVHIIDFGIAKMVVRNSAAYKFTQTGEIFGSPFYMSPEQCIGDHVDHRTDLYSIGCILFECLAGRPPFNGDNPVQIILKHLKESPDRLFDDSESNIPADLKTMVKRCLQKDPALRYQSATALQEAFRVVLSGRPLVADESKIPSSKSRRSEPRVFTFNSELFDKFESLASSDKRLEDTVIDCTQINFAFPAIQLLTLADRAKHVLAPLAVLMLLSRKEAVLLRKSDDSDEMVIQFHKPVESAFLRYPHFINSVKAGIAFFDYLSEDVSEGSFRHRLIINSPLLLTAQGAAGKETATPGPMRFVLENADGYRIVSEIARVVSSANWLTEKELFGLLRELENRGLIFPIFERADFLTYSFINKTPFRVGDYLVATKLIDEHELHELLERQRGTMEKGLSPVPIGQLMVQAGYLSQRALEIVLADQQYVLEHTKYPESLEKFQVLEPFEESLVGSLATFGAQVLLQSIASARKTGILDVEGQLGTFKLAFTDGKPIAAKLNRLKGTEAMLDFLVLWNDGMFVFTAGLAPDQSIAHCQLHGSLTKLLIDGALLKDLTDLVFRELPSGFNTIVEKVWNFDHLMDKLKWDELLFLDEQQVTEIDRGLIVEFANRIDGISTALDTCNQFFLMPFYKNVLSFRLLIDQGLVRPKDSQFTQKLAEFHKITRDSIERLGKATALDLLRASFDLTFRDSNMKQFFEVSDQAIVTVHTQRLKSSETSMQDVLATLHQWVSNYRAYEARFKSKSSVRSP